MSDAALIEANPEWVPHRIDFAARQVEFLRVPSDQFAQPGFLADYQPAEAGDRATIPVDAMLAMRTNAAPPVHFIFHTAFCRSTLLVKALNVEGVALGMAEPAIFANLSGAGEAGNPLVGPAVRLLARPRAGETALFIKPTNHSNRLIPHILQAFPQARAVLMSNPLETFLKSVASKGMHGRRWGRNLFLEMQSYAGMDFGMDNRELFTMSDMQTAGLAWLLNQNYFAALLKSPFADRLRVLDGDSFRDNRAAALQGALELAGIADAANLAENASNSPVFSTHSKLGGDVAGGERADRVEPDANVLEEIAQVAQWVGMIADQTGQQIPIRQTLSN